VTILNTYAKLPQRACLFALALTFRTAQQNYRDISTFLERMKSDKGLYVDFNLEVIVGSHIFLWT